MRKLKLSKDQEEAKANTADIDSVSTYSLWYLTIRYEYHFEISTNPTTFGQIFSCF